MARPASSTRSLLVLLLALLIPRGGAHAEPPALDAATAVAFADHLLATDDPFNALTWYRLGRFLGDDRPDLHFRMALCYELGRRHTAAEQAYLDLAGREPAWSPRATYRAAMAARAEGRTALSRLHLGEVEAEAPGSVWAVRARYVRAVLALDEGDLRGADRAFEVFTLQHPEELLALRAHAAREVLVDRPPRRPPALAAAMSAVVPGSGQMLVGHWGDGVMALLANGLLAGLTYTALRYGIEDDAGWAVTAGAAVGTVGLLSWTTNVVGAWRGARRANHRNVRRVADRASSVAGHPDLALIPTEVDWASAEP